LQHLALKPGDGILLPEYICDVITHPLQELKLVPQYYLINNDFTPIWEDLERLISGNTKAIMMVHYFGQPQDIDSFLSFCKKNNLYLIEDNAHGFGGTVNNQELGTFGDIGINSPRKILNTYCGGMLWIKNGVLTYPDHILKYRINIVNRIKQKINNINPAIKHSLIKTIKTRPKYEDPKAFHESIIKDYSIDKYSLNKICNTDLNQIRINRQKQFYKLEMFAKKNNLSPAIDKLHPESCPWFFPAYGENSVDAINWFKWGWKNNHPVFSWPSLPKEIISKGGQSLKRWEKLICFSIQ